MKAFSLVELSIVLVILGLLTGGILAGQSLIRASELRSVSTELQRNLTAIHSFRDKYFALPGDMLKATDFWLTDPDGCPTHTNRVGKTATCNGNGDGRIGDGAIAHPERFRFWQHLANAGLIEGSYTGVAGPDSTDHHVPGENVPRTKLGSSYYWSQYHVVPQDGTGSLYRGNYGTTLNISVRSGHPFLPEELWGIDTKLDDGQPGNGNIRSHSNNSNTCSLNATNYNLVLASRVCTMFSIPGF